MKQLLYIAIVIIVHSGCQKVVDVKLKSAANKYVIEGVVTDEENGATVKITQTKDFSGDNTFAGVSGATVTIIADNTTTFTLEESATVGVYKVHGFRGRVGHKYEMNVRIGTDTFSATSVMPKEVRMDTVILQDRVVFGESRRVPAVLYTDPEGKGNAYHFVEWHNGVQEKTIFVRSDENTDGKSLVIQLVSFSSDSDDEDKKIKTGDEVTIAMHCIDQAVYKYWYSLDNSATGEAQSATPANPVSNITGGALGYFSAHTVQQKTIIAD